jgi:hypothetical protein
MKKSNSKTPTGKITFGKRREGKHQKNFGPKAGKHKKYRGQGR